MRELRAVILGNGWKFAWGIMATAYCTSDGNIWGEERLKGGGASDVPWEWQQGGVKGGTGRFGG